MTEQNCAPKNICVQFPRRSFKYAPQQLIKKKNKKKKKTDRIFKYNQKKLIDVESAVHFD